MTRYFLPLLLAFALCGCVTSLQRSWEDALGADGRTFVQRRGAENKKCSLVKFKYTDAYGVVLPNKSLRLGEQYTKVSCVFQTSCQGIDYAILACSGPVAVDRWYLLQILSSSQVRLFNLDEAVGTQFSAKNKSGETIITQRNPGSSVYYDWYANSSGLRGPVAHTASASKAKASRSASKKSGGNGTAQDAPEVPQSSQYKFEPDPPAQKSAPKPSGGYTAEPYTIVID